MTIRIGRFNFVSREALDSLVAAKILQPYDVSPEDREKHDIEACFTKDGRKLKATDEELKQYWADLLSKPTIVYKPIRPNDVVPNSWRK